MNEHSATLQRALDALNSICLKLPSETAPHSYRERKETVPASPDLRATTSSPTTSEIPPDAPDEWREPFIRWLDVACVRSRRWFTNVAHLHNAFGNWEVARGEVPCRPDTFERLLEETDFLIGEVEGVVLVSGLALREDYEAAGV